MFFIVKCLLILLVAANGDCFFLLQFPVVLEHVAGAIQQLGCTDTSESLVFPLPVPDPSEAPLGAPQGAPKWVLVTSDICSAATFVLDCDVPSLLGAPGAPLFRANCQFCLVGALRSLLPPFRGPAPDVL